MQHIIGTDLNYQITNGAHRNVVWDMTRSVNPHGVILGGSGAGKTHLIKGIVNSLYQNGIQTHVFDVHGDITTPNESAVLYSETSGYGINPLEINPDPHFGGVRKRIESFIRVIEKASASLGVRQVGVLRDLLQELYGYYGLEIDDPATWGLVNSHTRNNGLISLDVPFEQKETAKKYGAKWNPGLRSWCVPAMAYNSTLKDMFPVKAVEGCEIRKFPTLSDLSNFIMTKMEESFTGVGREAMVALQEFHTAAERLNKILATHQQDGTEMDLLEDEQYLKAKDRVKLAVEDYLEKPAASSNTLKDAMLYTSYDMLNGVFQRVKTLEATGIFKATPAPFSMNTCIHRHNIAPLSRSEQKMFVLFKLQKMFDDAVQLGETKKIRTAIILDESGRYFDNDPENPVNVIATEGRKFGIVLIAAGQHPDQVSSEFLSSVATKIVLGLDEAYWDTARRKLNIPKERLASIRPRESLIFQSKAQGNTKANWVDVTTSAQLKVAS